MDLVGSLYTYHSCEQDNQRNLVGTAPEGSGGRSRTARGAIWFVHTPVYPSSQFPAADPQHSTAAYTAACMPEPPHVDSLPCTRPMLAHRQLISLHSLLDMHRLSHNFDPAATAAGCALHSAQTPLGFFRIYHAFVVWRLPPAGAVLRVNRGGHQWNL